MNNPSLVKDLFFFFARFPQKQGVLSLFNLGRSDKIEGYDVWMQEVKNLPDTPILPDIKHYVFGVDESAVSARVRALDDYFLFVDYGQIASELNTIGSRLDSFYISFTVAYPIRGTSTDLIERGLQSDKALNLLAEMRRFIIQEEKCIPWLKNFSVDHIITPWYSKDLPSFGWTAVIERQGADILNAK